MPIFLTAFLFSCNCRKGNLLRISSYVVCQVYLANKRAQFQMQGLEVWRDRHFSYWLQIRIMLKNERIWCKNIYDWYESILGDQIVFCCSEFCMIIMNEIRNNCNLFIPNFFQFLFVKASLRAFYYIIDNIG